MVELKGPAQKESTDEEAAIPAEAARSTETSKAEADVPLKDASAAKPVASASTEAHKRTVVEAGDKKAGGDEPGNNPPTPDSPDIGEGVSTIGRVAGAVWETFVETAASKDPGTSERSFEYRKGIEGMSMGSLHYEMLTTTEGSDNYNSLKKEYESGWGVAFVDVRAVLRSVKDFFGIDAFVLTTSNLLQTLGLSGDAVDGIPVQNKWMSIVNQTITQLFSDAGEDEEGAKQKAGSFIQNIVTGQMERVAGAPMPVFLEDYGEGCGIYKIVIGPRSVVVVSDPVILKTILQSSPEKYTKGILSEVLEPIMGAGLIPADPVTWRRRRRAIAPGFHKRWLADATELMVGCAESLCNELDAQIRVDSTDRALVNMEEKFTSVSLDIIGQAIFDYDFDSVERESPVVRAVYGLLREAERRAQSVIPYWNLPGASTVFKDQKDHADNLLLLNAVLDELIRACIEDPDRSGRTSLLKFLVETKNEDVTNTQLRDDLMTLLVAGHETTAALLTWTLHELMKPEKSEILAGVVEEVDAVLDGCRPTYGDFDKLPKLRAVLVEALRLYPQPPMLIRRCEDGDTLKVGPTCSGMGEEIKFLPGQDIFISTWSLQRSKELWGEDAAEFRPSRWDEKIPAKGRWNGYDPSKKRQYPNEISTDFAFVPFGGGARKCLGDYFALLEAEVIMASLLQRFKFKRAEEVQPQPVGMTTGATIHTIGGLATKVVRRTDGPEVKLASQPPSGARAKMDKNSKFTVAERVETEQLTVPTVEELRMLFSEQAEAVGSPVTPSQENSIESAYLKCREVTREHSKTFYLGSQLLANDEQRAVWAIYNWCRETDELCDGPGAENTTMLDLEQWEERLTKTFKLTSTLDPSANWEDLALAAAIKKFGLIERPFQDMVGGMAMDLVKFRYATFQELEVYCYRVAGTVGIMTLPILGFDGLQNFSKELKENTISAAMNLGVAFQLTNILRDVGEDARRGRIYVPLDDLRRFGITEEEILAASNGKSTLHTEARWRDFMEFQFERCEKAYEVAKRGIVGLSEVSRLGVMAALYVYGAILDKVRKNNYDNFSRRAYVDLFEKFKLLVKAWWKCQELKQVAEENVRTGKIFAASRRKRWSLKDDER